MNRSMITPQYMKSSSRMTIIFDSPSSTDNVDVDDDDDDDDGDDDVDKGGGDDDDDDDANNDDCCCGFL